MEYLWVYIITQQDPDLLINVSGFSWRLSSLNEQLNSENQNEKIWDQSF